jgi:hypothetical protein
VCAHKKKMMVYDGARKFLIRDTRCGIRDAGG